LIFSDLKNINELHNDGEQPWLVTIFTDKREEIALLKFT